MLINLSDIINIPGGCVPFECSLDFSKIEFSGEYPAVRPVEVTGGIRNTAGVLTFTAEAETILSSVCDRCLSVFENPKVIHVNAILAADAEPDADNDIIPLDGDCIDIEPIIESAFILAMDTKTLCSPDCRGLCYKCGAELNKGPCGCASEIDPRLAALQKFLDKSGD